MAGWLIIRNRLNKKKNGKVDLEALLAKKQKELRAQEIQKQRVLDIYQAGTVTLDEVTDRLETIRVRIKKTEQEYALLENEVKREQQQFQLIEQLAEFKNRFDKNLNNLTFDQKRQVVRLLVSDVVVDSQNHQISVKHIVPTNESLLLRPRYAPKLGG